MLVDFLYGQGPVQSEDKSESGEGMNVMIIIKIKQCCTVQINSYVLNILKTGHYTVYWSLYLNKKLILNILTFSNC